MNAVNAYPHEAAPTGASAVFAARLQDMLPRLETRRLILRAPVIGDFQAYGQILMSERAVHLQGPFSRREAWLDFTQCVAMWHLRGHGLWTITAKGDAAVLGFVLICMEYGDREPELGWFLTEAAEGHGYAQEAAEAARDHGTGPLALASLVSYIDPPNARSIRLAERLGAVRDEAAAASFDEPVLVYRHWPRDDAGGMEAYA